MTTFEYKRLQQWARSESNGWTSPDVAARFEAGTRGEHYMEVLPFGPTITSHPAAIELMDLLARTNMTQAVLLDYGCGNGVYGELLAAAELTHRWQYIGADVNSLSIESCRRRFRNNRFEVVTDGEPLPFSAESVDVVLASGVLEVLERPAALLAEFRRITTAWVALCRIGVRPTKPAAIYWQTVRHAWGFEEHCFHVFNQTEFEAMIASAELEIVWSEVSITSGEWVAPDDPDPLQHFSYLLRRR